MPIQKKIVDIDTAVKKGFTESCQQLDAQDNLCYRVSFDKLYDPSSPRAFKQKPLFFLAYVTIIGWSEFYRGECLGFKFWDRQCYVVAREKALNKSFHCPEEPVVVHDGLVYICCCAARQVQTKRGFDT